jgi:hypothetical protein
VASRIAREVLLELARQVFSTHLIVLDGQGVDFILGRSWMKLHKAILDIAKWLVSPDSDIWQGHLAPSSHCLHQGIHAPHRGKEYRGNIDGMKVSRGFSERSTRNVS